MKQLALLLVGVALSYAATIPVNPQSDGYFSEGREYVYQYKGQVLSGLPGVSKEVAGIKIVADTRIQMKENGKCLLRLEGVKLHKVLTKTENPAKQQVEEKLQRLDFIYESPLVVQLVKPIEFTYVSGKVSNIIPSMEDPVWSTNIKKGIVELMLVNIRGTNDLNEPTAQSTDGTSITRQKKYYRVMENGVAGNCESVYDVKVSKPVMKLVDNKVPALRYVLNITKTRDLIECQRRNQRSEVSLLSGQKCEHCWDPKKENVEEPRPQEGQPKQGKEDFMTCLNKVRYGISLKDHDKFLIDTVVVEGKHVFMPFGEKGGKAVTFVNQTFVLKSNKEIPDEEVIPEVQNPKQMPEDLSFIFQEKSSHDHDTEEESQLSEEDIRSLVTVHVEKIIAGIQQDKITEEAPLNFIYMVKSLKRLSPIELQNVFDRLGKKFADDDEPTKVKKQIVLDAILQVENDKAVEILTDEINERQIIKEEASQVLSTLALINKPTVEMLDKVLRLCRGPILSLDDAKDVKTTCWLTFGSLVHKACKVNKICTQDKLNEYSLHLLEGIDATSPNDEKRFFLKAIGNAGLVLKKTPESQTDSIDRISELIKHEVADIDLRVQAIYSLRRVCKEHTHRVISLLMPFLKDADENHEIRIASYVIIMDCEPKLDDVQFIVTDLHKDKSKQVISFIYTHLEGLVKNPKLCKFSLTEVAKKVLLTLKPIVQGMQYSKRFMWSLNAVQEKVALTTEASMINTPTSPFPVRGAVKLGATILNRQMNLMEVGFHAKCLREIAEKILGVARPASPKLEKLLRNNGRVNEDKSIVERDLAHLDNVLPTTRVQTNLDTAKASAYMKLFGNELRTITVDKTTIWEWLEGRSEKMQELENKILTSQVPYSYRKIFSLGRGMHKIPTQVGLPLKISFDTAAVLALDISGKARMTPTLTEVLRTKNGKMNNISIAGSVKPRVAVTMKATMIVDLDDTLRTGIGLVGSLNSSVVLNGDVIVDVPKRLFKSKLDTPTTEHQVLSLRSRPFTCNLLVGAKSTEESVQEPAIRNSMEDSSRSIHEKRIVQGELMAKKPVTKKWSIGKESLGVEVEMTTRRVPRSCGWTYRPTQLLFNGPIDVNVITRRGVDAPEQVTCTVKLETKNLTQVQYQAFKDKYLMKKNFTTESSSEEFSEGHGSDNSDDKNKNYPPQLSQSVLKLNHTDFENWMFPNAKSAETKTTTHKMAHHQTPISGSSFELFNVLVNISTIGSQPIRELVSQISLDQQDEFYKALRIDILTNKKTFIRDPVHQDQFQDSNDYANAVKTLCIQAEMEHPANVMTLPANEKLESVEGLSDVAKDPKVLFKFNTQWGRSCMTDQKIQLKARVERSEEQKKRLSEETPYKMECMEDIRNGNKYTKACKRFRLERDELRAVNAELTHNEKTSRVYLEAFYQGIQMVKNMLWQNVRTKQAKVFNLDKTVLFSAEIEENQKNFNVTMKDIRENIHFDRVWIPMIVQDSHIVAPYNMQKRIVQSYGQEWLSGRNINQCKALRNNSIITFDKVLYNYKESQCNHILAKDCSNKERFVILSKVHEQDSTKKVVTVYLDNTKIQFIPDQTTQEVVIQVNDTNTDLPVLHKLVVKEGGVMKQVAIDTQKTYIMSVAPHKDYNAEQKPIDTSNSASSQEDYLSSNLEAHVWDQMREHIKNEVAAPAQTQTQKPKTLVQIVRPKLGDSIMLFAPEQELKVFFDGHNIKIELAQKYKDMLCGLCGDFNGETSNEFVGPNREVYKWPQQFGRSYQVSTPECSRVDHCTPVTNFTVDRDVSLTKEEQTICVSRTPVPRCPDTCVVAESWPIDVEFVCAPSKETSNPNPFEGLTRQQVINKYGVKRPDYKRTLDMAVKCRN
ncbi:vitellogenin-2-like [Asterias amurensis]|uniref:vitellogenin-2-like n=1 Tax=Asterias amurensis TaxID=7602 RepID=UPI003AB1DE88